MVQCLLYPCWLSALAFLLLATAKLDESSVQKAEKDKPDDQEIPGDASLIILPLVLFLFSVLSFMY
jgi:hypothetical protein